MRLDAFLSSQLGLTRSEAGAAIRGGGVTVGGKPVKKAGTQIDPQRDPVCLAGARVSYQPFVYLMLNKPAGVVSATRDRGATVLDLVPPEYAHRDLFPAGRLDRDTTGFLLLTDDGQLAHALLSPKRHVDKVYLAETDAPVASEKRAVIEAGLTYAGVTYRPCSFEPAGDRLYRVTLREGKYHEIKFMIDYAGVRLLSLKRISFGGIALDESLAPGEMRALTPQELERLRNQTVGAG